METRFKTRDVSDLPSVSGAIEKVYEIPSRQDAYQVVHPAPENAGHFRGPGPDIHRLCNQLQNHLVDGPCRTVCTVAVGNYTYSVIGHDCPVTAKTRKPAIVIDLFPAHAID